MDDRPEMLREMSDFLDSIRDLVIVGKAANGNEAVKLARTHHPDLIVMDVSLSEPDGFQAARQIRHEQPNAKIILVLMHDTHLLDIIVDSIPADGFVCKSSFKKDFSRIMETIRGPRDS